MEHGQDLVAEPLHAKAADTANDEIRAVYCLGQIFDLIVFKSCREIGTEFGVAAGFPAALNDFPVQRCADKTNGVAVFSGGERQGGAHHAGSDDGNCFHNCASFRL